MNLSSKFLFVCAFCFIFSLLFSQFALAQDFFSNDNDLQPLDSFIQNTEEQQKILDDLMENLYVSMNTIKELKENNSLAKELTAEFTELTERNIRNLQDAILLISEIRKKLITLENVHVNSNSGGIAP